VVLDRGEGVQRKHFTGRSMYDYIRIRLAALRDTERGASAVEYGLLVALIAIMIIGGATLIGTNLDAMFNNVGTELTP
jgi:pilus assembly protein Flp/PilA